MTRAVVLVAIGFVLAPGTPRALYAEPDQHRWTGRRVVAKPPGLRLKVGDRLIHPRRFDIYRVEKVDGPLLYLRGEREGFSGWTESEGVLPVGQAVAFFTDYIRANPNDPYGYSIRAIIRERELRDLDLALADYDEVIRLAPTRAYAYNNRGMLWSAKGEYERAIDDYSEALRLDPHDAVAWNNRGSDWMKKKGYDLALVDFDQASRLAPGYDLPDFNRIYVLFLARRDGAVEGAKRFLQDWGWRRNYSGYVAVMGHLAAVHGAQAEEAKSFLDDAATRCDASKWPYPIVRYLRGEINEARLLAAANDKGKMAEARCYLGLRLIQAGQKEAALAHFQWIMVQGDPSFIEYTVALAEHDRLTRK